MIKFSKKSFAKDRLDFQIITTRNRKSISLLNCFRIKVWPSLLEFSISLTRII
jgi:hypothetical protein